MKVCPKCGYNPEKDKKEVSNPTWYLPPPVTKPERKKKKKRKRKLSMASDIQWKETALKIKRRDKYRCVRCHTKEKLQVHHIIPRDENGGDNDANLITLCVKCHDIVEINDLRSRTDIIASFRTEVRLPKKKKFKKPGEDVDYRPSWHTRTKKRKKKKMTPNYTKFYGVLYEVVQMAKQGYRFGGVILSECKEISWVSE